MATLEDVSRIACAFPAVTQETAGHFKALAWKVGTTAKPKLFAWDRPLGKKDAAELGEDAPTGVVLGVKVADLIEKEALIKEHDCCFTITHFNGYPAVLVRLDEAPLDLLEELITEAWLATAPKRICAEWLAARDQPA